jgi:hypothetical protein
MWMIKQGDREPGYGVGHPLSQGHSDQTGERSRRRDGVQPGVARIDEKRSALDRPAHAQLVSGDQLIADDADGRGEHPQGEVGRASARHQLVVRLPPGESGARPDGQQDNDAGKVLRPSVPGWVAGGGLLPGCPKSEVDAHRREDVPQVVKGVREQCDAARQHRDEQLEGTRREKPE